jgi:hypothetical protein
MGPRKAKAEGKAVKRPRRIKIIWEEMPRDWGAADDTLNTIWLDPRMDDLALLAVAAHEVAHIVFTFIDEETISLFDRQLSDVFKRILRVRNQGDE